MTDTGVPSRRCCTECGGNHQSAEYCPDCGNDGWEDVVYYDFERDVELPYVFSQQVGNDDWGLWRSFCFAVWGTELRGAEVANLPDELSRMKHSITQLYYKLDASYELHGPFLSRTEAREA